MYTQVYFQSSRRDLLGIVNLRLRAREQRVDRTFHFYHPEKTFLKRRFELHQSILAEGLESEGVIFVDSTVLAHIKQTEELELECIY